MERRVPQVRPSVPGPKMMGEAQRSLSPRVQMSVSMDKRMRGLKNQVATNLRVSHIPDFLSNLLGSAHFMRLSLEKGARAVLSRAAYRKFGVSRSFFARCGIPQLSTRTLS